MQTVAPDETALNEPSRTVHLDQQSLIFQTQFILKVLRNFVDIILSSAFLALYGF